MQLSDSEKDFQMSSFKKAYIGKLPNFVTVSCRLKPLFEGQEKSHIEVNRQAHSITISDPFKSVAKTFDFDQIFNQDVEQSSFTQHICQPLLQFIKNGGQGGLIFSYGITNSGKTYSILGTPEKPGILLNIIKDLQVEFSDEEIRIVACQLYKDEFFSLKTKGEKLTPREKKGIITFDEQHYDIINQHNMKHLFQEYLKNRNTFSTVNNTFSSRSHAIFKISTSRFNIGIVDLAGSERYPKKNQTHDEKETIFINKSLHALKRCITSLEVNSSHIPYRQSKLTQALVEYFVPMCRINIIVNVNQARTCLEQNILVMDYTSKAKNISENPNSEFSRIVKSSQKKYNLIKNKLKSQKKDHIAANKKSAFKSKIKINNQILELQEKEDIGQYQFQLKAQIDHELKKSIMKAERRSSWKKRFNRQVMEIVQTEQYDLEAYLRVDEEIRKKKGQALLQDLVNANFESTTNKKGKRQQQSIQICEVGVGPGPESLHSNQQGFYFTTDGRIDLDEEVELKLLRTSLKQRLRQYLLLQNSQSINSDINVVTYQGGQQKEADQLLMENGQKIQKQTNNSTQLEFDDESNYSTPSKSKHLTNLQVSKMKIPEVDDSQEYQEQDPVHRTPEQTNLIKKLHTTAKKIVESIQKGLKSIKKVMGCGTPINVTRSISKPKTVGTLEKRELVEQVERQRRVVQQKQEKVKASLEIHNFQISAVKAIPKQFVTTFTQYDIVLKQSEKKNPSDKDEITRFDIEIQTDQFVIEQPFHDVVREKVENSSNKNKENFIQSFKESQKSQIDESESENEQDEEQQKENRENQKEKDNEKPIKRNLDSINKPRNRHRHPHQRHRKVLSPNKIKEKTAFKNFSFEKKSKFSNVKLRKRTIIRQPFSAIAKHTRAARNRNKAKIVRKD